MAVKWQVVTGSVVINWFRLRVIFVFFIFSSFLILQYFDAVCWVNVRVLVCKKYITTILKVYFGTSLTRSNYKKIRRLNKTECVCVCLVLSFNLCEKLFSLENTL